MLDIRSCKHSTMPEKWPVDTLHNMLLQDKFIIRLRRVLDGYTFNQIIFNL